MKYKIRICGGPRCKENFSEDIFKEVKKIVGGNEDIELEKRGCMGICQVGPSMEIVNLENNEIIVHSNLAFNTVAELIKPLLEE